MPAFQTAHADEFIKVLRKRLPEKTLRHSLSVAELMDSLADRVGIERAQAVTAGLLHDLCKATKPEELLKKADNHGIRLTESQRRKPALLHGPIAAEEARRRLGVEDRDVYDAIYYHTTGRAGFGPLGLALYFSDYSEPYRPYPEAGEARLILEAEGFKKALHFVANARIEEVRRKSVTDPLTEQFWLWLHTTNGCKT